MSQYKASMERIQGKSEAGCVVPSNGNASIVPADIEAMSTTTTTPTALTSEKSSHWQSSNPIISCIERNASFLMMPALPLLWCILAMSTMDSSMLASSYATPLLGIMSASLANAVPVGGGIVFVPILSLFGMHVKLGAAFAVSTMTFGNGVFGFLSWLQKSPESIAWHIVPYAVIPAWIGAALGIFFPFLSEYQCKVLFSLFCLSVAGIVWIGIKRNVVGEGKPFSIFGSDNNDEGNDVEGISTSKIVSCVRPSIIACCCSFSAGLVLVAHIGIGNAMTTFLVSSLVWNLPAKSSVVTSILVGGWTSVVPFLIHLIVLKDVQVALWVMGLPGVYIGARIAPMVHERLGMTNVLWAFVTFLLVTAVFIVLL